MYLASNVNPAEAIMLFLFLGAAYLIPTIIAVTRKHNNAMAIAVVNIALGWTFLGYLIALVWSLTNSDSKNQIVINQIAQQPSQYPPPIARNEYLLQNQRPALPVIDVSPAPPEKTLKSQLEEIKELHDEGLISDEEYQNKRNHLLA